MIQGRNILIYEGDVVIAAAKSCTINNNAEALENSSPASGTARSYTVGRTGWDISISTLVLGMKDHLLKVGQAYRLVWKVRGNDSDAMQGTAICTNAQVEATVGNLAQGSFQFLGSDDNGTIVTPPTPTPSDYVTEQDVVNIINQYDFTTEQWVQNYAGIANGMITIGHNSISPVTSVAMTVPTGFSVSGSPISKTGTLALAYATGYEGFTTALKEKIEALYSWFEVDADGDVKTKDTAGGHVRGLYSESFVSSLGKNSSSGGGGVDLTAVWASLTNTDSPTYSETLKININHIPNIGWSKIDNKPTTLAGYGITDAKIASGTITLGSNTITPLTASSSLAWGKLTGTPTTLAGYGIGDAKIANGVITLGSSTITPVTSVAMTVPTGFSVSGSPISKTGTLALAYATGYEGFTTALKEKIEALYSWFEVDAAGDIKTKDMPNGTHRGFYTESFVSALGANSQGGGSSTFDEPQMWTALQSTTGTYATTKIATSHIPDMASTYGYLKSSALNGYATQSWVNQQGFLTTHQSIYALTLKAGGTAVTTFTPNSADASLDFVAGTNISLTRGTNQITIANTYSYTLPLAASGTRGGVQIGYLESNSGTSTTRNYAVKLSSEKMYVNVPWTDTTYKLTLNGTTNGASGGTSLGSFYAPTASGTANQVLISGGSNTAPSWTAQSNLSVGTAAKLNTGTTTYTAWGQTYWSSGVPQSISGNMTSVGSITPSANGNALGTTSARFNIYGTAGNFSGNVSITGTLGVTGATTLSSTLSVAGGITLTTTKKIYFGDTSHYLELDSTGFHFSHGVYSDSFVSALGANSSGGGSGTFDEEAMWEALGTTSTAKVIASSHIPNLSWSKITSGKPTTLSGYGISDAYTKTQVDNALSGYLVRKTYSISGKSAVRITFNNVNGGIINARVTRQSGSLVLIGNGYGDEGIVRNNWVQISESTSLFSWCIPTATGIEKSVEIYNNDTTTASIVVASFDTNVTFTELSALSTTASTVKVAYASSLEDYLPLSGGTITVASNDSLVLKKSTNTVSMIRYEGSGGLLGYLGFYNNSPACSVNGEYKLLLHEGNYSSYALPLTGGTISTNSAYPLIIADSRSSSTLFVATGYKKGSTTLGYLGFSAQDTPVYVSSNAGNSYPLLHSNNYSSYALPLTGGTITLASIDGLTINKSTNATGMIRFTNGDTLLGYLGYYGTENPACNVGGTYYSLVHGGNYDSIIGSSYIRRKTYGLDGGKAVRITFNNVNGGIINVRSTLANASLILVGNGYGDGGTIRNNWVQLSNTTSSFSWCIPTASGIEKSVEIYNNSSNSASVVVASFDTGVTFTELSALSTTASTVRVAYASDYLPLTGGTMTGSIKMDATAKGYYLVDSAGVSYPAVFDNGSYLCIGANAVSGTHHTGNTYISAGSGEVYISRLVNNSRTNYKNLDAGNTYVSSGIGYLNGNEITTISGNAATATKATQDGDGRTITSTYLTSVGISGDSLVQTKGGTTSSVANIFYRDCTVQYNLSTAGWYRIAAFSTNLAHGGTCFLLIRRTFNATSPESYIFAITLRYGSGISISQLSGTAGVHLIDKIRVEYANNTSFAPQIDIHVSTTTTGNAYRITTIGSAATFATATLNPTVANSTYEYATRNGMSCSGDFYAGGEVTAASDERLKTIVGDGNLDIRYIANAPNILFKWNNGQDDKVHGGSLAQYFLTGAKHFVLGSDKDYYSLNYGALATSMAISIAKEVVKHEDRITLLEKENARLKARVEELEERRA